MPVNEVDPSQVLVDPWSGLSHKALVGPAAVPVTSLAPSWVGSQHRRRLNAYTVLSGYLNNVARFFLPTGISAADRASHREYGDAALVVAQIAASLLGEDLTIMVNGADADAPSKPDAPVDPGPGATPEQTATFAEERVQFERDLASFTEAERERQAALERQEWFDQWIDDEDVIPAVIETEKDAVGLGDGVYLVAWSNTKKRVRLRLYDPQFYFPVLDDADDFPNKVHLAWEFENEPDGKRFVRRITFERRKMAAARRGEAQPTRRYAYQAEGEEPSEYATYMTDGVWSWDDLGDRTVYQLDESHAKFSRNEDGLEVRDLDLLIDFVPVVHIPNTLARKHHYGTSSLTLVAQILDDLQDADTDLNAAAAIVGAPPISMSGQAPPALKAGEKTPMLPSYGPGSVFWTGDGKMDSIDTSNALDALLKYLERLLDRLSINARLPKVVLGKVEPGEAPSGISLKLTMTPFEAMIREMRLARRVYTILWRFVQRLAIVGGVLEGPVLTTELRFGAYLPSDVKSLSEMLIALLGAHGISRTTALRMLVSAGLDLDDDLSEELARIEHEDFEGGRSIADATGSEESAAKYLGIEFTPAAAPTRQAVVPEGGGLPPIPAPQPGAAAANPPGAAPAA